VGEIIKAMDPAKKYSQSSSTFDDVPKQFSDSALISYLQTKDIDWKYVSEIKKMTDFSDQTISNWLNISVKTFRSYKQPENKFKENLKEHVLLLISLIKHGISVFATQKGFETWLNTDNFFFDSKSPISFLNTVSGIRYVQDRLTALEYGDNA
jgi:putative toxin-antitoxin system antitoxin component (TIGR02293 family)